MPDTTKVIWKSVKEFEGVYEVSNTGIVRSVDRHVRHRYSGFMALHKGKELRPNDNGNGYKLVFLTDSNKHPRKAYKIHRLVADTFLPNPDNKPEVNHIDANKNNNAVCNLEWATRSENSRHCFKYVRPTKVNDDDKTQIRLLRHAGASVIDIAKQFNITGSYVRQIIRVGKTS